MAFATGSEVRLAYVAETAFGTIPTSPAFKTARFTGGPGLRTNKVTGTSAEIQPDRNIRDEFLLGMDVTGSFPFEMSYGSHDDFLAAALMGTWTSNVLINGLARSSFTVEQTYQDGGATISERRFAGTMFDGVSLSLTARAAITGSFTLMGQRETEDTGDLAGATYAAPPTTPIMTASANVASLAVGSLSPQPRIRKLDFTLTNHLYTRPEVASLYTNAFGEGRCDVTGTLEAYFEAGGAAAYAAALAHQNFPISFTAGSVAGSRYTFAFPNCKLGNADISLPGNDQDVILSLPFRALYDSVSGATISLTRAV